MKPRSKAELRRQAEEQLGRRGPARKGRTETETARVVHELEVHQLELEMQNEELQRARSDLSLALTKYSELYDFAPTGYVTLDRDGVVRQANLEAARLLGVERSRLEGRGLLAFVAATDYRAFADFLPRAFAGPEPQRREVAFERKEQDPIIARIDFLRSEDGKTGHVVITDLTDVRRAEAHARAAEAEKLAVSERSRRALLSAAEDQRAASAALARTMEDLRRSNEDLEQYAYVASHDLQEPLRMVANYVELLRQRYQGQLDERADKYIGYAATGAVRMQELIHDLLSYSRVGRSELAMNPVNLNRVVTQARENLAAAIGLGDARIESGPLPIVSGDETQLVQLFQNLIENAIKFRGKELPVIRITADTAAKTGTVPRGSPQGVTGARATTNGSREHRLRGEAPEVRGLGGTDAREGLSPVFADTETRRRGDAGKRRGDMTESAGDSDRVPSPSRADAEMVTIRVADNGIGIDPKHRDRIFRLFQRLHTQEEYPGTGIGLAVCKKIVERHGGVIRVEPAEGGGSVFRFTLPRQPAVASDQDAPASN